MQENDICLQHIDTLMKLSKEKEHMEFWIHTLFVKYTGLSTFLTQMVEKAICFMSNPKIFHYELPLPCGAVAPMEVVSNSRDSSPFLTKKIWLSVPIKADSFMPLSFWQEYF